MKALRPLAATLPLLLAGCAGPQENTMQAILESHPGLEKVVEEAAQRRLQILFATVERDLEADRWVLRQDSFRAGEEYFYPASSVKMFAAVAALQRLAELRYETGLPLDLDTPLAYHPLFEGETLETRDETNVENGAITVRHLIRKLFLVSDNEAFNKLYELVGQDRLAASLDRAGLSEARIVHRLSESRTAEENLRSPRIDFLAETPGPPEGADEKTPNGLPEGPPAGEILFALPERTAEPLPPPPPIAGIEVGRAYLSGGEKIESPMDFTHKNRISLRDLQRGLCMVMRPDVDCGGPGFDLEAADRAFLWRVMKELPRESENPVYDPEEYPDDYVKFFLPGLRQVASGGVRVYNKIGQAYGFSTENSYVVDQATGRAFFLAATLYTNEDGVLNDDQYEYREVAQPFLATLGKAAARHLWR